MKKLLMILVVVIAFSSIITACAPATQAPAAQPSDQDVSASPKAEEAVTATPAPADMEYASTDPISDEVRQDIEAMMPILDSIVRAMEIEDAASYAPRDGEFFWSVLYLMANNWGETHPLVEIDIDETVAPRMVVQEFASAAFTDYDDLLPISETLKGVVRYDESYDTYRFAMSDAGDTYTGLISCAPSVNGAIDAKVGLYDGSVDELLATANFTLLENPYADGISDPIYLYSVNAVTFE